MESPFKAARTGHPVLLSKALDRIEQLEDITPLNLGIIKTILLYTPNQKLFDDITTYDTTTIDELANISTIGFQAIRAWGGNTSSLASSRATSSPSGSATASPSTARPGQLRDKLTAAIMSKNLSLVAPASNLGHKFMALLGIKKEFPDLPEEREPRPRIFRDLVHLRQTDLCQFSGGDLSVAGQTAHLFPYSLLDLESARNKITWRFLVIFLGEELRDQMAKALISPEYGIHSPCNRIALFSGLYGQMDKGFLSMIPIRESQPPGRFIDIRIVWHLPHPLVIFSTRLPANPEDQYDYDEEGNPSTRVLLDAHETRKHGVYRIGTSDAVLLPIPSPILLFWHSWIWKVLGSAGFGVSLALKKDQGVEQTPTSSPRSRKRKCEWTDEDESYQVSAGVNDLDSESEDVPFVPLDSM
ncbi:hypothetical protein TWF696_004365 [Orbilia brochopaga]|uniref:HNH nuclease domain-containing protein n=1 Tax=Orbilia brochopaga TaxID=3140254 RepID=A0AAV9V8N8_9PEZI